MRSLVLAGGVLLLAAAPAAAQTEVGGSVPSMLVLELDDASGFSSFPAGPGEHDLIVRARVTSTANRTRVSVADGDVASGRRLGRMASNASVLDEPLEARVGSDPFQPLDARSIRSSPSSGPVVEPARDDPAAPADRRRRAPARDLSQDPADHAVFERPMRMRSCC